MRLFSFFLPMFFLAVNLSAQPYVDGGKTRHRFAQINFGADVRTFLPLNAETKILSASGAFEVQTLNPQTETRLIMGGTHFWGHVDFYIAVPVAQIGKSGFTTTTETGMKVYPWRVENKKIRPYLGASWMPSVYKQAEGVSFLKHRFPLVAGFTLNRKNHLFDLGFGYLYRNQIPYYITPTQQINLKTQQFWVGVGYKFMLDATLSAEKSWQSGKTEKVTKSRAENKMLDGFTLALGISSTHFTQASAHLQQEAPFADRFKRANIFPELGVGYYFHNPDLQFNLLYRATKSNIEAFGFKSDARRSAIGLEAYKFLFDYHGFVPFVGLNINYEMLNVAEVSLAGIPSSHQFNGFKPGITFGWDIRPNRIQSWYLRTNLRYTPNLDVKMSSGKDISLDNLEFNFIQLVVFPGRMF